VNTPIFQALNAKQTDQKWDADSQYARKLIEKNKPHCLIHFGHGGFFFSRSYGLRCDSAVNHRTRVVRSSATTIAEVPVRTIGHVSWCRIHQRRQTCAPLNNSPDQANGLDGFKTM
jgi:hypothetical protein